MIRAKYFILLIILKIKMQIIMLVLAYALAGATDLEVLATLNNP